MYCFYFCNQVTFCLHFWWQWKMQRHSFRWHGIIEQKNRISEKWIYLVKLSLFTDHTAPTLPLPCLHSTPLHSCSYNQVTRISTMWISGSELHKTVHPWLILNTEPLGHGKRIPDSTSSIYKTKSGVGGAISTSQVFQLVNFYTSLFIW